MLQGYYEVEQCKKNRLSSLITGIPNIRRILFWDTDFDKIDWGKNRNFVIARVIERGNREEQEEIARFYGIRLSDFKKFKKGYIDGIRMASLDDIAAMKINAISRGGRKKDFWDVHKLLERYTIGDMLELHKLRHPWEHDEGQVLKSLIDFSEANGMETPVCLEGKDWDEIKLTFIDLVQDYDN